MMGEEVDFPVVPLMKDIANALVTMARDSLRVKNKKSLMARLRGAKQWDQKALAVEIASTIEMLKGLGFDSYHIGTYLAGYVDNRYEADLIRDLRACYKEDLAVGDEGNRAYKIRYVEREFPLLWAALRDHLEG